jgi:hypothetical protein
MLHEIRYSQYTSRRRYSYDAIHNIIARARSSLAPGGYSRVRPFLVSPPSGAIVEPKRAIRFATSRRALCIMSLTQTTTWLCCYLCIGPPAGTMLFLSSHPLGRLKYDCPNYAIIFIIDAIVVAYNFFVLCLYHTCLMPPQSFAYTTIVPMYHKLARREYS